ncbi:MAG TPA: hypothetical protein VMX57_09475, partial [Planctomycetota bacterium]|nr:hypothetical protein [Planctomycetota bacterium]
MREVVRHVPIPKSRDPFVNTPLLSLGRDGRGVERFWISTWNANVGTTGVVVDETGACRVYRPGARVHGAYSASPESDRVLWLCNTLDGVIRLDLRTGKHRRFDTGAPAALVFQGMPRDPVTGKLFAAAHPGLETAACSFDTRRRRAARVYRHVARDNYMRVSFPNGDGTWSVLLACPGVSLLRWDPRSETVETRRLTDEIDLHGVGALLSRLIRDDAGRVYFPGFGWLNPRTRRFAKSGPRPEREACWFARRGRFAWGAVGGGEETTVRLWDLETGEVTDLCTVPDAGVLNLNVTASGRVVCVNTYGVFHRFHARTGALELAKPLPTDA